MKKIKIHIAAVMFILCISLSSFVYLNYGVGYEKSSDSISTLISSGSDQELDDHDGSKPSEWVITTVINIAQSLILSKLSKA